MRATLRLIGALAICSAPSLSSGADVPAVRSREAIPIEDVGSDIFSLDTCLHSYQAPQLVYQTVRKTYSAPIVRSRIVTRSYRIRVGPSRAHYPTAARYRTVVREMTAPVRSYQPFEGFEQVATVVYRQDLEVCDGARNIYAHPAESWFH
jgi:hypothetical protein